MAGRWLLKTEPSVYAYADLERDGSTVWDGVKNALALKYMSQIAKGDEVLFYHTGDEKAVVGVAKVTRGAYPDPKAKDPKLLVIDLAPRVGWGRPVTLAEIKASSAFAGFDLVRLPRLSVMPVSDPHWAAVMALARSPR